VLCWKYVKKKTLFPCENADALLKTICVLQPTENSFDFPAENTAIRFSCVRSFHSPVWLPQRKQTPTTLLDTLHKPLRAAKLQGMHASLHTHSSTTGKSGRVRPLSRFACKLDASAPVMSPDTLLSLSAARDVGAGQGSNVILFELPQWYWFTVHIYTVQIPPTRLLFSAFSPLQNHGHWVILSRLLY